MLDIEQKILSAVKSGISKSIKSRVDNHIHATNLINFCPREYMLCKKYLKPFNDYGKNNHMHLTFMIGKKIEECIITALKNSGILFKENFIMNIVDYPFLFTGECDAIIAVDNMLYVIEIKSIDGDAFNLLEKPLLKHMEQLRTYLMQLKIKNIKKELKMDCNIDFGFVLYVSKKQNSNPLKIYRVYQDKNFVLKKKKELFNLERYLTKNKMPLRICKSEKDLMAKKCSLATKCFEEE